MNMPGHERSLWNRASAAPSFAECRILGADAEVALSDLTWGSSLGSRLEELRGRSVLVRTADQLAAALALIELDGIARRIVLCPPDLSAEDVPNIVATAAVDAVVFERSVPDAGDPEVECFVTCSSRITPTAPKRTGDRETEWILLTSGTTGAPKLVSHTVSSLTGAITRSNASTEPVVWSTFYDIRRYGGLQILLRAVLGGESLVLSSAHESTGDFLVRAGAHGVTHISGTPSHWRRALMSPSMRSLAPRYVRLSGEIADQAILDGLRSFYPESKVAHAFASTEAGVAFDVGDGLAGFPTDLIGQSAPAVEMKIEEGSLRLRSGRTASRYLGVELRPLKDTDGFVDTGDLVERRGDRCYFIGRKGGIINVGGLKVHPEEVEAIINRHPGVRMSLVKARRNPITGAVVVADVVPTQPAGVGVGAMPRLLEREILEVCHHALARHKVPVAIRFVSSLNIADSGKLARAHA
jgi:acyl-CoA synthetase (AMP-forming)/AMP-acid ligase II